MKVCYTIPHQGALQLFCHALWKDSNDLNCERVHFPVFCAMLIWWDIYSQFVTVELMNNCTSDGPEPWRWLPTMQTSTFVKCWMMLKCSANAQFHSNEALMQIVFNVYLLAKYFLHTFVCPLHDKWGLNHVNLNYLDSTTVWLLQTLTGNKIN